MLEELAYRFATDKSHDDHKYVDLYSALFDPIKNGVRNVTEIGAAAGQSLQVWHEYFPAARLWGVDNYISRELRQVVQTLPRATVFAMDSSRRDQLLRTQLADTSMDIIIDDGDHFPDVQMRTLGLFWRLLRPGGYYCIEDISTGANRKNLQRYRGMRGPPGYAPLVHNETYQDATLRQILRENDSFFVDSLVGHRDFRSFRRRTQPYVADSVDHNSHVLVIRKRLEPRQRPVVIHRSGRAMNHPWAASNLRKMKKGERQGKVVVV